MKYLLRRLSGTERYRVCCSSPSRICGRLMSEFPGTVFGAKVESEDSFSFYCIKPYAKRVLGLLGRYDCEVGRISRSGIPSVLSHILARPGLMIGLAISLAVTLYCNGIVWDMEISGNDNIGDAQIEQTLARSGFAVGKRYKREKLSAICNRFIIMDDRFTWITINMSGNKAFVQVAERTKKTESEEPLYDSGLVSQYDCIIERPQVIHGTSLVKKGDVVEKGAVLISPVETGNGGNEYISGAKGSIYAKTVENFTVNVPFETLAVRHTDEVAKKYNISFLGASAELSIPFAKLPESFLCTSSKEKIRINDDITLPIVLTVSEKRGFEQKSAVYGREEAEKKAYEIMYSKMSRDLSECEILSTEFRTVADGSGITIFCRAECLRDVIKK